MKVTHIIDSGGYYGAEVMLVHLCQAQQKAGLDVHVISIGTHGNYKKPLEERLEEYGIPFTPWRMLSLPDLRESFKILKYCKSNGTDILHSHGYKGNILLGLIPKRWRKLPVITTIHGYTRQSGFSKMAANQWLDRFCLPRLDAVVLVSEGMRHQIKSEELKNKLHIVRNGIPAEIPTISRDPITYFSKRYFNIGAIGRLSHEKNFSFLIKAMPEIKSLIPNARLVIYGEGKERKILKDIISKLQLERDVFLPGYIDDSWNLYSDADVFVNCSLTEGMPISIIESLRAGLPVIASNIPANREILKGISDQCHLADFTHKDFSEKILLSKENFKKNTHGKSLIKKYFLDNYTSLQMASEYSQIYHQINDR